jgi:alkaline phosphatase D
VTSLPNEVLEISISPLNQFWIPIRTYHSSESDKQIAYYPDGNQKYAIFIVDTTNRDQPLLEVHIKIKGQVVWKHIFEGKKIGEKPIIDQGRTILEKGWEWLGRYAFPQQEQKIDSNR